MEDLNFLDWLIDYNGYFEDRNIEDIESYEIRAYEFLYDDYRLFCTENNFGIERIDF